MRLAARGRCSIALRGGCACGAESALAQVELQLRHVLPLTMLRGQGVSTQQALSSALMMDATNVARLLNKLESRELVERRRSLQDQRRHLVKITEQDLELLERGPKAHSPQPRSRCSPHSTKHSGRPSTTCSIRPRMARPSASWRGWPRRHIADPFAPLAIHNLGVRAQPGCTRSPVSLL